MRKMILLLVIVSVVLVACGGGASGKPANERIIGKWSGMMTNKNGGKIPIEWEFLEGGTMVVKAAVMNISFGGTWAVEGSRLNFVTEVDPEVKNYRDIEFVSDDVVKFTKAEADITETFTRVK